MLNNSSNEVFFKIAEVISDQLKIDESRLSPDVSFDKLNADSLDQIQILMKIEELFNIEISDEETLDIFYIKDLVSCVNKNISKKS